MKETIIESLQATEKNAKKKSL